MGYMEKEIIDDFNLKITTEFDLKITPATFLCEKYEDEPLKHLLEILAKDQNVHILAI